LQRVPVFIGRPLSGKGQIKRKFKPGAGSFS
jgi:hypothetical protein